MSEFIFIEKNSLRGDLSVIWGVERLLWETADKYGLDYDLLYNLAWCESKLQHEDTWGKAGEYGIFQWKLRSWRDYNKQYGWELNILNLEDQIELTARVLADGDSHNWENCWNIIKGR